ncbi:MAG: hypothetical protein J6Y32_07790 [Bacteroidales bacterium]|nr:hypothetical protein [Bacteroidales bacterium]
MNRVYSLRLLRACVALLAIMVSLPLSAGQEGESSFRSLGFAGGVQSLGITYNTASDKSPNFHSINLFLDIHGLGWGKVNEPGGALRYDYNFGIGGNERLLFYAGPGAMAGYVADSDGRFGVALGLSASLGLRYLFPRNISLGVSLHPTLGYHIRREGERFHMHIYEAGLWHSVLPEISVSYCFNCNKIESSTSSNRKFTFSLESAFAPSIYNYIQRMYFAEDGYRNIEEINAPDFSPCGELLLSAGWRPTDSFKLSLLLGYAGIRRDTRLHEILLRGNWYLRELNASGDRFFLSLDMGCGLNASDWGHPFALGKLGFGYRLALTNQSALEFFLRSHHAFATPALHDDTGAEVPADRALRSRMYITGLSIGAAIEL